MIKKTRWKPDTCNCIIIYEWDSDHHENDRYHELHEIEKCQVHYSLKDEEAFHAVISENRRKNTAVNEYVLLNNLKHEDVDFSFDEERNLKING